MIYFIFTLVIINSIALYSLYKARIIEKSKSRVIQLFMEGLFEYLIFSKFIEYKNNNDKVYEKIQLYRFLIKKFEDHFGEKEWNDFFVKKQKANYNLFTDYDYLIEPLRSVYLPFFILCLYKEANTRKDAERIINESLAPLAILAEVKNIISHKQIDELNSPPLW